MTVTLPCHVVPVGSDLIGSNKQGLLLQGIKGIVYGELSRLDGRQATFMQMPDGKVVGLLANTQGMTVLPEIGQESQWAVQSHPMEIPELCDFLMSRERVRQQREAMPDLESGSTASTAAMMKTGQVGACSSVQMPSRMAQSAVIAHNRLQSPCFDDNWNSQQVCEVLNTSLQSYEEDEAKRAAREAKLKAQEQIDLDNAKGASLYQGKRDNMEQVAASGHMATEFAVMKARHNRATGEEESNQRKEAHLEEERNQAQCDLVEQRLVATNKVRSAIMALIDVKRAQSEGGKGKGSSRPWQTTLSTRELEMLPPHVLIMRAREALMRWTFRRHKVVYLGVQRVQ